MVSQVLFPVLLKWNVGVRLLGQKHLAHKNTALHNLMLLEKLSCSSSLLSLCN